jgi:tetratricopeptide (TPR) repeat protein
MKKLLFLFFALISIAGSQFAMAQTQEQDAQLALYHFNNGEFDNALPLYEKLFNKYPINTNYYNNYFKTQLQLKQYDDAIKTAKKQLKKFPQELTIYVDLGLAQIQNDKAKEAQSSFEEAIKRLYPDELIITKLATAFVIINQFENALQVYNQASKLFGDDSKYVKEIAGIYASKGDAANVIKIYLDFLSVQPAQIFIVESKLQDVMEQKSYQTEIQTQLYKRIQKNSDQSVYSDLLIWYFIQQKDFDNAYIQVKAIDKRNKEQGDRIYSFAQSAFSEGSYQIANEAYQYLIDTKGKNSPYYELARMEQLNVLKTQTAISNISNTELLNIEKKYQDFLLEFGRTAATMAIVQDYARIEALYLDRVDTAIAILENIITIPTQDRKAAAYCKLDLGDYYLLSGNVWDSQLLYSQVDKDFKDEPIAEEARFKNAKLSYYKSEFEWSQAQLDILKGATSDLISNDAISLSVFITDNTGLDTVTTALSLYASADLLLFQHKYQEAIDILDTLAKNFPEHPLMDDVLCEKAMIYLQQKDYEKTIALFDKVEENYSSDLLADDATFKLADLFETQLNQKDKAMDLYKSILTKYPGSLYVIEARKRFRALRGDILN